MRGTCSNSSASTSPSPLRSNMRKAISNCRLKEKQDRDHEVERPETLGWQGHKPGSPAAVAALKAEPPPLH